MEAIDGVEEQDTRDMLRLCDGVDAGLNHLMDRHAERVFHYLLRLLRNKTEASDLTQETFVRVYLNRSRFNPRKKFTTWLYAIATNLAKDRMRWRKRHRQTSLDGPDENGGFREYADSRPGPGEQAANQEEIRLVRDAVRNLKPETRIPLVLAEYEGKSHAEIAGILKCSSKAVEMRIYRARQELKTALSGLMNSL